MVTTTNKCLHNLNKCSDKCSENAESHWFYGMFGK